MSLSAISCRAILYTLNAGNAFIPTHKLKYWRTYHHHHQILRNRTIISVLWNKVLGHGLPELRRCWRQTLPPVVVSHWPSARHLTLDTGQAWPRITPADTSAVLSTRRQAEYPTKKGKIPLIDCFIVQDYHFANANATIFMAELQWVNNNPK